MRLPTSRVRWIAVCSLLALAVVVAFLTASSANAQSQDRTSFDDQFDRWIDDLADARIEVRRQACGKLRALADWRLTLPRTIRMLRAATREFPKLSDEDLETDSYWDIDSPVGDTGGLLIYLVSERARPEHAQVVAECFPRYRAPARAQAMRLLSCLQTRESAEIAMQIIRTYAPRGELPMMYLWGWGDSPECARIFFPEVLKYSTEPHLEQEALSLLDAYAESPEVYLEVLDRCTPALIEHYRRHKKEIKRGLQTGAASAIYSEEYAVHREPVCRLLELLASCPTEEAREELRQALAFGDLRVRLSAATGLVQLGEAIPRRIWREIAASAETRINLFEELQSLDRLNLFPAEYLTQAALAESDLVRWLVDNSEEGRPPAKVELVKVVPVDPQTDEGVLDFYVFQFCTEAPTNENPPKWQAGVAGPYPRLEQPTANAHDSPHSDFEPIESKWPEEHIGDLPEIIQEYRWRAGIGD